MARTPLVLGLGRLAGDICGRRTSEGGLCGAGRNDRVTGTATLEDSADLSCQATTSTFRKEHDAKIGCGK